jgi:hypothetical protein
MLQCIHLLLKSTESAPAIIMPYISIRADSNNVFLTRLPNISV